MGDCFWIIDPEFLRYDESLKTFTEAVDRGCSVKKGVIKNFEKFTGKRQRKSLFLNKVEACNFIKKKTLAQVFSCEFREIFENTFLIQHVRATAYVFNIHVNHYDNIFQRIPSI